MSQVLQVAGMVSITAGAVWLSVPLGLIVAGIFLVIVGISLAA